MSARKSKKADQVEVIEAAQEEVLSAEPEVVEPVVVETEVAGEEPVVEEPEMTEEQIAAENRMAEIETEIVKLQDRIKELRKEARQLEKKDGSKNDGPTKMDKATQFYKDNPGLARKDYIAKFQSELGLTLAGARTYIQLIMSRQKAEQKKAE